MMRSRLTHVPEDMAGRLGGFIVSRDGGSDGVVMARTREVNTLYLLMLLYQLRGGPATFTQLYARSGIRMKRSFLRYLRLCTDYGLAAREGDGARARYAIRENGLAMLGIFLDGARRPSGKGPDPARAL